MTVNAVSPPYSVTAIITVYREMKETNIAMILIEKVN